MAKYGERKKEANVSISTMFFQNSRQLLSSLFQGLFFAAPAPERLPYRQPDLWEQRSRGPPRREALGRLLPDVGLRLGAHRTRLTARLGTPALV